MKRGTSQLRQVCQIIPGFAFKSTDLTDFGIPVVKIGSITEAGGVDLDSGQFFPESLLEDCHAKFFMGKGDIVLAMTGEGKAGRIRDNTPCLLNQRVCMLKPLDIEDKGYLWCAVRTIDYSRVFAQVAQGVAQANISGGQIELIEIPWPDKLQRCRIASILSAYDDLIENNNRRIALLEQSARLLYEEWFVRLRFPGREHTRIVDGVPRGWEKIAVSRVTSFLKRGIAPQYDDDAAGLVISQKCVRDGRLNLDLARHQSRDFGPDRQIQVGDVLVNSTGEGTLGRVAQVKAPVENCTVDTHVTIVRPARDAGLHFFGLAMLAYESQFSTMGRGATNQTELSPAQIGSISILLPPHAIMDEFESFAAPIYEQITNLTAQSQKARAARDLLLPRLMSGEVAA